MAQDNSALLQPREQLMRQQRQALADRLFDLEVDIAMRDLRIAELEAALAAERSRIVEPAEGAEE